jgi:hypothetical protein
MLSFSEPRVYKLYTRNKLFNNYKCGFVCLMRDVMWSREIHLDSVYGVIGHCLYFVPDNMLYARCHNSSMRRNGNLSPDLLVPRKFNIKNGLDRWVGIHTFNYMFV